MAAAAPPVILHDPAYDVLVDLTGAEDDFADCLKDQCKLVVDTRRMFYYNGIVGTLTVVELFPTFHSLNVFVKSLDKQEGKTTSVVVGGNDYEFKLRFPIIQRNRFKALRFAIVCQEACGHTFDCTTFVPALITKYGLMVNTLDTSKFTQDMDEKSIPLLSLSANAQDKYSVWKSMVIDYMHGYRSAFTGTPLSYLVRIVAEHKPATDMEDDFDTLDDFLCAKLSYDADKNHGFDEENRVLAKVIKIALGTNNRWGNDLTPLLRKGKGREAWLMLERCVQGDERGYAYITTLEEKLKKVYTGKSKSWEGAIQAHNSAFNKTIQDLALKNVNYPADKVIRDYLSTIQDPSLQDTKDRLRGDLTPSTDIATIQSTIQSVVEGRIADAVTRGSANDRVVKQVGTKHPKKGTKDKKKRKAHAKLSDEEANKRKKEDPDSWFLTTKTLSPDQWNGLTSEQKKACREWRDKNRNRSVKAVVSGDHKAEEKKPTKDTEKSTDVADTPIADEHTEKADNAKDVQFGRKAHESTKAADAPGGGKE